MPDGDSTVALNIPTDTNSSLIAANSDGNSDPLGLQAWNGSLVAASTPFLPPDTSAQSGSFSVASADSGLPQAVTPTQILPDGTPPGTPPASPDTPPGTGGPLVAQMIEPLPPLVNGAPLPFTSGPPPKTPATPGVPNSDPQNSTTQSSPPAPTSGNSGARSCVATNDSLATFITIPGNILGLQNPMVNLAAVVNALGTVTARDPNGNIDTSAHVSSGVAYFFDGQVQTNADITGPSLGLTSTGQSTVNSLDLVDTDKPVTAKILGECTWVTPSGLQTITAKPAARTFTPPTFNSPK